MEKDRKHPGNIPEAADSSRGGSAERKYKDSVFRLLFNEKGNLLSLCNAVRGTHYTDSADIRIVTLENALAITFRNDLAFMLDTGIHFYEQQSSRNPNMPLRFLHYVSDEYRKLCANRDLFSPKRITLPEPVFVTLYNGELPEPERRVFRLSDSYENAGTSPALELVVLQLNINSGFNEEIKEACRVLGEYVIFTESVAGYRKEYLAPYAGMTREQKAESGALQDALWNAIKRAVAECIDEGILKEFLLKHMHEVIDMEYNMEYYRELHEKTLREETWEEASSQAWGQAIGLLRSAGMNDAAELLAEMLKDKDNQSDV